MTFNYTESANKKAATSMPQKTTRPTNSNDEIESINQKLDSLEIEKEALIKKREALLQQSSNPCGAIRKNHGC